MTWGTDSFGTVGFAGTPPPPSSINTALSVSSTWAQDGSYSLALTATAAGSVGATTPVGASGVPCVPGETVRAMGFFHSPTTPRPCTIAISFYNTSGTLLSTSTSTGANSTLTGNGGQAFMSVTAPGGAAFMSLALRGIGLSVGEVLNADCLFLGPGSTAVWSVGGFVGTTVADITFSDDNVNWFAVRNGTGVALPVVTQQIVVVDYEGALGFTRHYQAQVVT